MKFGRNGEKEKKRERGTNNLMLFKIKLKFVFKEITK